MELSKAFATMYVKGIAGEDKFIVRSVMTCGQQKAPDFQGPFVSLLKQSAKLGYTSHGSGKNPYPHDDDQNTKERLEDAPQLC